MRDDRAAARKQLAELLAQGSNINPALKVVGRSRSWYETQRREDPAWAKSIDSIRGDAANASTNQVQAGALGFNDFSEKYLFTRVPDHMQNVVKLLEGKELEDLHPSIIYEKGSRSGRFIVNMPPNHAKTMTLTINYVTYRIIKDPSIRIIVVSKTLESAKKFVYAVKQRLTHPMYAGLQVAFGPADGFKASSDVWTSTKIYLAGDDSSEKDPTLEAVGMGGQIYGARADLIILDDVVVLSNAAMWDSQMTWLRQEVGTRPGPGGVIVVVGTRVSPIDLYSELRKAEHYTNNKVPWTYFAMPAVLQYADDPEDWVTLWPKTEQQFSEDDEPDEEGLYPRWTGPRLDDIRNEVGPSRWSMVYMNQDVAEDSTFDPLCVRSSVNGMRKPGAFTPGAPGQPQNTDGFWVFCSMDPAMTQDTASVAYAIDPRTSKRYVLDVNIMTGPTPAAIRRLIYDWTELYHPAEWIIEQNAFQLFLTQDEEIRAHLANRGVALRPHYTGSNKIDPDFGVASLAPLFGTKTLREDGRGYKHDGNSLIELPDLSRYEGPRKLVEQLITWQPGVGGSKLKQDTVMALWFAELRARDKILATRGGTKQFATNRWVSAGRRNDTMVVKFSEIALAR